MTSSETIINIVDDNWANVTLPEGLTKVRTYFFYDNNQIQSVILPSTVTSIENNAFENCSTLRNVTLPAGLKTVGINAFNNAYLLKITSFPTNIETIGNYAFSQTSLSNDLVFNSLQTIGTSAFSKCRLLKSLTINNTSPVTVLNNSCFEECHSLQNVNLSNSNITAINTKAFYNCLGLATVTFPNSLNTLQADSFYIFYNRSFIFDLSNTKITSLPARALAYVRAKQIKLPSTLVSIESGGATNTGALYRAISDDVLDFSNTALTTIGSYGLERVLANSIILPNTCTNIGVYAFTYTTITSINMPPLVNSVVPDSLFRGSTISNITWATTPLKIGSFAFAYCPNVTHNIVDLSRVTELGSYAFASCNNINFTTISLPEALIVNDYCFGNCLNLTSLTFPKVQTLGANILQGVPITTLTIPSTVTSTNYTLYGADKLETLNWYTSIMLSNTTLPENNTLGALKTINFKNINTATNVRTNPTLQTITITGTTPTSLLVNAFSGNPLLTDIKVSWANGAVPNAPWGATNATITYNYVG